MHEGCTERREGHERGEVHVDQPRFVDESMGVNLGVEAPLSRAEFRLKFSNLAPVFDEPLVRQGAVRSKGVSGRPDAMRGPPTRSLEGNWQCSLRLDGEFGRAHL